MPHGCSFASYLTWKKKNDLPYSYSSICALYVRLKQRLKIRLITTWLIITDLHVAWKEIRSRTCWRHQVFTVVMGLSMKWWRDDNKFPRPVIKRVLFNTCLRFDRHKFDSSSQHIKLVRLIICTYWSDWVGKARLGRLTSANMYFWGSRRKMIIPF